MHFLVGQLVHSFLHPTKGFLKVKATICNEAGLSETYSGYRSPKLSVFFSLKRNILGIWFILTFNTNYGKSFNNDQTFMWCNVREEVDELCPEGDKILTDQVSIANGYIMCLLVEMSIVQITMRKTECAWMNHLKFMLRTSWNSFTNKHHIM